MNIWLKIDKVSYNNVSQLLQGLKQKNYQTSHWIDNIFEKKQASLDNLQLPINLYRIKLVDLGFNGPTELKDFYDKAIKTGFKLLEPEVALLARELYTNQPTGEWLRFATPLKSMIDTDGVPHLPKLGKALGKFFIETYWSYPKAIFHPHNEFVLSK